MSATEQDEGHTDFPSQAMLGIRTTEDYVRFREMYLDKQKAGCTITIPIAILTDGARQTTLQPVYIYTSSNFPSYEMLESHGTRFLERGAYNCLREYYLGQPIPRQSGSDRGQVQYFMQKGMTWAEALIARAVAYEGGDCPAPDDEECMARSPYRQITEDNFPPYALLKERNADRLTPERYAEIRRRYIGSYAPKEVTEHVMELLQYLD